MTHFKPFFSFISLLWSIQLHDYTILIVISNWWKILIFNFLILDGIYSWDTNSDWQEAEGKRDNRLSNEEPRLGNTSAFRWWGCSSNVSQGCLLTLAYMVMNYLMNIYIYSIFHHHLPDCSVSGILSEGSVCNSLRYFVTPDHLESHQALGKTISQHKTNKGECGRGSLRTYHSLHRGHEIISQMH